MSKRISLALVLAAAGPALAGQSAPPPAELTTVTVEGEQLTLGPFITENYLGGEGGKSDPVNLIFLNTDPRAIRQQLMTLDGIRSSEWNFLPNGAKGCVWMDGMGYEQAAYLEPEGWVGGVVQLVCTTKDSPLGNWYRFHVRLFRSGPHTIGGAHFELNTPGTAQHEVLSWEMARDFVRDEMARLDADDKGETQLFDPGTPGTFRTTNGLVYYFYVWGPNVSTNQPFLTALGLGPPSLGPTPIPATGFATVYAPDFTYVPARSDITLTDSRIYNVPGTPKPFCGGENIQITGGPLTLTLRVQTNPSGKYQRTYTVAGKLTIKTLATGAVQEAIISEAHRGMLTDNYEEVTQEISQVLLPIDTAPGQSLHVIFGAGQTDYWVPQQNCAIE